MAPTSTNPPPPASSSPQYDLEAMQASPEAVETQQPGAHQAMGKNTTVLPGRSIECSTLTTRENMQTFSVRTQRSPR